jgi:hypothetical protein
VRQPDCRVDGGLGPSGLPIWSILSQTTPTLYRRQASSNRCVISLAPKPRKQLPPPARSRHRPPWGRKEGHLMSFWKTISKRFLS